MENAATAAKAFESLAYIQIGLQFFIKKGMNDLLSSFYMIQLACYFSIYTTPMPACSEIYIDEFNKLISMKAVSPDNILKKIDENYSMAYFMSIT